MIENHNLLSFYARNIPGFFNLTIFPNDRKSNYLFLVTLVASNSSSIILFQIMFSFFLPSYKFHYLPNCVQNLPHCFI
jgi:hypothetical protein